MQASGVNFGTEVYLCQVRVVEQLDRDVAVAAVSLAPGLRDRVPSARLSYLFTTAARCVWNSYLQRRLS